MQHDGGNGLTDSENAERTAEAVGGEERALLFGYCAARARRIVGEQAALIVALLPDIVRRPVVIGDELEVLIEARRPAERTRTIGIGRSGGASPVKPGEGGRGHRDRPRARHRHLEQGLL
jgi:hypothetical protein